MLARRIRRDVAERGRDVEGVVQQYLRFVKPSYETYVLPSSQHADIVRISRLLEKPADSAKIVPGGADNTMAIDLISTHIRVSDMRWSSSCLITIPRGC